MIWNHGKIRSSGHELRTARIEMHEASERILAARTTLKQKEAALLLSGAIVGKNADSRCPDQGRMQGELEAVEAVRVEKADAQLRQDLASMRVQELQWLIRNDQATADLDARGYVP